METKPDGSEQLNQFDLESRLSELTDENAQLKDEVKRLNKLAVLDPLTGAYNRRYFNESIQREIEEAKRYEQPLSLIMFDLDYFKKINDKYGHQVGDYVLKEIAKLVTPTIRGTDLLVKYGGKKLAKNGEKELVRYGGEEFVVMLPQTDLEQASILAERIRKKIAEKKFEYNGCVFPLTISSGVTEYTPGTDKEQFIKTADQALYKAKENGRNQIVVLK